MELITDLHIHSHYSRATSKEMNLRGLYRWGKIKGINIIGTGDFTHPQYFREIQTLLEPAEAGLYKLKDEYAREEDKLVPISCRNNLLRFILTVEVSNIYSKHGKVRKLHNLIIVNDIETAAFINTRLGKIGNLKADGRPILGLDSKELLRLTIESGEHSMFVPAHIWTPWFAMFGSKSGFDTIEEAFEELTPHIKAVETGLSSDPFMNWRLSQLDGITLISNSDAHSPAKLAREANIINTELNYDAIIEAMRTNGKGMIGTIEFFPDEGKYHLDGHRLCGVRFTPAETKKHNGICPGCGRPLTIGVEYRVEELADRNAKYRPRTHKLVEYIIPLIEIIAELMNVKSTSSKKVEELYQKVIAELGDEFSILRKFSIEQIKNAGFPELAKGIENMRKGEVLLKGGYDGVYGIIKVFAGNKHHSQLGLAI